MDILVKRKDGSTRIVRIMKDKALGEFRFVNLTSDKICESSFKTYQDAERDLYNDPFVLSWEKLECAPTKKKEKTSINSILALILNFFRLFKI